MEDAWLGYALHALLPQHTPVRITIVGLNRAFVFDHYGLYVNNYTFIVHDKLKLRSRVQLVHNFTIRQHCLSNASLSCRAISPPSHLAGMGRHYGTACEMQPGNQSCRWASVNLHESALFWRVRENHDLPKKEKRVAQSRRRGGAFASSRRKGRPARIATHQSTTYRAPIAMRVLFLTAAAAAYHLTAPPSRAGNIAMDSSWRPKNVDPLGEAWGVPKKKERTYSLWLDLREAEVTFAQQSLVQLFYAVRRVVDEAGKALPRGAKVQGLLYDESRYDRADTIGADLPIFLDTGAGNLVNATVKGSVVPVPAALRAPLAREDLKGARRSSRP